GELRHPAGDFAGQHLINDRRSHNHSHENTGLKNQAVIRFPNPVPDFVRQEVFPRQYLHIFGQGSAQVAGNGARVASGRRSQQPQAGLTNWKSWLAAQKITLRDDHVAAGAEAGAAREYVSDFELLAVDFDLVAHVRGPEPHAVSGSKLASRERI